MGFCRSTSTLLWSPQVAGRIPPFPADKHTQLSTPSCHGRACKVTAAYLNESATPRVDQGMGGRVTVKLLQILQNQKRQGRADVVRRRSDRLHSSAPYDFALNSASTATRGTLPCTVLLTALQVPIVRCSPRTAQIWTQPSPIDL